MSSSDNKTQAAPTPAKPPGFLRIKAILAVPILLVPAWLLYFFMIDGVAREQVLAQALSVSGEGAQAEVEDVTFSIIGPKLHIVGLKTWQHFEGRERHDVLHVGDATFDVEFWSLLERKLIVNELTVSKVRYAAPQPAPVPPGQGGGAGGGGGQQQGEPPKTPNDYVNEYLKKVEDFLKSDEYKQGKEVLEKLREYMEQRAKSEEERAKEMQQLPGAAGRASYVLAALRARGAPPSLVVKKAGVKELEFVFAESGNKQFGQKLSNVELMAKSVSSDPASYKLPMEFTAGGDLDGKADRRVNLGLVIRFDPAELVKLEQVKGEFTIAKMPLDGLVDTGEFGDMLSGAELSLVHYAPEFPDMGGRTRLRITGALNPPGFSLPGKPSKLAVNFWFGGFRKDVPAQAFMPSGLGLSVENIALDGLLAKSGGFPLPLRKGASVSFGTCDEKGRFDLPESAVTWHDGFKLFLRMRVDGLHFDEAGAKGKQTVGLPADLLAKGLNRVLEGLSAEGNRFEVIAGFSGRAGDFKFAIKRPGLRTFIDACINALYLKGDEISSLVKLPFDITKEGKIALESVDKQGLKRKPLFDLENASDEGLSDLRVKLSLAGLNIAPKAGESKIAGLPADDFCEAFNTFINNQGEQGANFRCRLFNAKGEFSPALESPGLRGLVDALVGVFSYSGKKLNTKYNLPFTLPEDFNAQFWSVNADGSVRNMNSLGADSDSLADLRVALDVKNARLSPKPGQEKIFGLPARDFCDAFNRFAGNQSGPIKVRLRAFGADGGFSPALESPGVRGFVDAAISAFGYSGKELNERFNLPFLLDDKADAQLLSVNDDGTTRNLASPGSDSDSLQNLRVSLNLSKATFSPKPGQSTVLGLPAREFCAGFNQFLADRKGAPLKLTFGLFDKQGGFAPALVSPGMRGILDTFVSQITLSGKTLNDAFDLPFKIADTASVRLVSIGTDGKPRDDRSLGADSDDLKNLRVVAFVSGMYAIKKPGQDKILGIPADYFTFAWNAFMSSLGTQGFPFTFQLMDGSGKFSLALMEPSAQVMMQLLGNSVGVAMFEKNFGQIDGKYKNAFESFKKGDLSKVGDIAKTVKGGKDIGGVVEPPKEIPKEVPKIPKLPWG